MFVRYRTEAIFLKKLKRFEADEFLIAYTKEFGKIGVTGKSIRKIKSKLRSSSELFCYSDIEFVRGKYYNILTDSELISSFSGIKKELGKSSLAFRMADLLDSFLAEEERDEHLWTFIVKSFHLLEDLTFKEEKKKRLKLFYYYFSFKFLELLGYGLEVGNCSLDKKKKGSVFSPREGGLVCEVCSKSLEDPLKVRLTDNDRELLAAIKENSFEDFLGKKLDFDFIEEAFKNYLALLPSR